MAGPLVPKPVGLSSSLLAGYSTIFQKPHRTRFTAGLRVELRLIHVGGGNSQWGGDYHVTADYRARG